MMIKSMTGFGRCEAVDEKRKITVEIKSVNHRYLDFNIKMPKKLSFFDSAIRTLLKEYMLTGKVDIFISYEDFTQSHMILQYNHEVASQYMAYFKKMAEETGMPYQNIINYYLLDCVKEKKHLEVAFSK